MATVVFDNNGGGGDNLWSTNTNWVGDALPAAADVADINANCTLDMDDIVAQLDMAAGITLTIQATYGLTGMTASMLGTGSIVTGAGCTIAFDSASNLNNGNVNLTMNGASGSRCTFTNAGAGYLDWAGEDGDLDISYTDMPRVYRFYNPGTNHIRIRNQSEIISIPNNGYFAPGPKSLVLHDSYICGFGFSMIGGFGTYGNLHSSWDIRNMTWGTQRDDTPNANSQDIAVRHQVQLRLISCRLTSPTMVVFPAGTPGVAPGSRVFVDNLGYISGTGTRGPWKTFAPYWDIERSSTNPYTDETYCALVTPKSGIDTGQDYYADLEFWIPITTGDTLTAVGHGRRNGLSDDCADMILDEEQAWYTAVTHSPTLTNDNQYYEFTVTSLAGAAGTAEKGSVRLILRVKEYVSAETFQWGGVTVTVTHADTSTSTYVVSMQQAAMAMPIVDRIDDVVLPAVGAVIEGVDRGDGEVGTYHETLEAEVLDGVGFGEDETEYTGTVVLPAVGDVQEAVTFGASSALTGTFVSPAVANVLEAVEYGASAEYTGTYHEAAVGEVKLGVTFGPSEGYTGTYGPTTPTAPTLTVTNDGDGDAVTATVTGDAGVTNTLYYRATNDTVWTEGSNRVGDGAIAQTGLDDNTHYWFVCVSDDGGGLSLPSLIVGLYVTSGRSLVLNVSSVRNLHQRDGTLEVMCIEEAR